ncbi:MAG: hypothetical protein GY725_01245 [bacterium]|nr:hypothetical protein [bacterium]
MRIAFVTTDLDMIQDADHDRPLHDAAFARKRVPLLHPVWHDPGVDWQSFDLVVLRSPWDYTERLPEFLDWLEGLEARVPICNEPAVVRWNLDKHYLAQLGQQGVPVVPTVFANGLDECAKALEDLGSNQIVVKPVISAGSRNTGRFFADDPAAMKLAKRIIGEDLAVMIQEYAASVMEIGETSLVFFSGEYSHGFRKGELLAVGGGFVAGEYLEDISSREPSVEERAVANRASTAIRALLASQFGIEQPLLYARLDVIHLGDGSAALLEAELFEPCLFLKVDPLAADRFAQAVLKRCQKAGS